MSKLETRLAALEAVRTPASVLLIKRLDKLLQQGEHLPAAVFTAKLGAFMDTCNDAELEALLEHLDNEGGETDRL